jgi:C4-dicarboxylate transporter, DctM subunit
VTTILACAGFSSICGSNTATAATMSAVALKPMSRAGVPSRAQVRQHRGGLHAGRDDPAEHRAGGLRPLHGQSIGKLFAGSILPGLALTSLFVLTVKATVWRHPDWAQPGVRGSRRRRLATLPQVVEVALLFGVIMAAMFSGVVTPTEAAGLGALLGIVGCTVRGKLSRRPS